MMGGSGYVVDMRTSRGHIQWCLMCVLLYSCDFTSPAPSPDGIFTEPFHTRRLTDLYHHISDCPYFLYTGSSVERSPQVTLELRVDLG